MFMLLITMCVRLGSGFENRKRWNVESIHTIHSNILQTISILIRIHRKLGGERERREGNSMCKNKFILIIFATDIFQAQHLFLQMLWDCDVDNENVGEFMNKTSLKVAG